MSGRDINVVEQKAPAAAAQTGVTAAETLELWKHRARHWYGMFAGRSYYHHAQSLGRAFSPGELKGYFNDLTAKTNWVGQTDPGGFPLSKLSNGKVVHFPILLCQKALGHWDLWLLEGSEKHRRAFLELAGWLAENQDDNGGWDSWGAMGQSDQFRYSAMAQGEALSVMVRAHELTAAAQFKTACARAVDLMQRPVEQGGVCVYEKDDVFLEEFPARERDTVLNGWIFALFGLYDYLLTFPDQCAGSFFIRSKTSLTRHVAEFDTGYWSYYSSGTGRLASPFYHHLHISQLQALQKVTSEPILGTVQRRWESYARNRLFQAWAVVRKGAQKLTEPRETTIVG